MMVEPKHSVPQAFVRRLNGYRVTHTAQYSSELSDRYKPNALFALTCSKKHISKMHFVWLFTLTHLPHKASIINPEGVKSVNP